MKRIICFVLCFVLVFSFVACGNEPELVGRILNYDDFVTEIPKRVDIENYKLTGDKSERNGSYSYVAKTPCEIESKESNFSIEVDEIKFTLPMTVGDFVDLGFELSYISPDKAGKAVNLNSYIYSDGFTVTTPKGNTFEIYATSPNRATISTKNAIIMQVSCNFYEGNLTYGVGERKNAPKMKFFKNITETSSLDGILKELKTPNQIHFSYSQMDGITTYTSMQLEFNFSDENHIGGIFISLASVRDTSIERTSYITDFSYRIDPETLK